MAETHQKKDGKRLETDAARLGRACTHVGVLADLVNDGLVKMTRVTHERSCDVVGVLHAVEDRVKNRKLRALAQLHLGVLSVLVNVLDPVVVSGGQRLVDVVLEDDQVGVRDLLGINRRDEGSSISVDALVTQAVALESDRVDDGLCGCQQRQKTESSETLHDEVLGLCGCG